MTFEQVTYEGYGPGGVAVMVDILTDNRNRSAADIRNIFARAGGNLGATGSVAWMFERRGVILVPKDGGVDEDDLLGIAIEAGAEDMTAEDDQFQIVCDPADLMAVRSTLEENDITFSSAEVTMLPKSTQKVDADTAKKALRLMDALEEHDDVQEVYSNFDIPADVMEQVAGE
jgi:YebC/PmpR family DNA-binding regulatory protein